MGARGRARTVSVAVRDRRRTRCGRIRRRLRSGTVAVGRGCGRGVRIPVAVRRTGSRRRHVVPVIRRALVTVIHAGIVMVPMRRRAGLRAIADEPVVTDRASPRSRAGLGSVADWPSMPDRASVRTLAWLRVIPDRMRVVTDRASVAVVSRAEEGHVRGRVRSSGSEYERRDNACNPEFH